MEADFGMNDAMNYEYCLYELATNYEKCNHYRASLGNEPL